MAHTDAEGKAAAGATRVRHGHGGIGDLGPDGLPRAGSRPVRWVRMLGWSGPGCGLLKLES